MASSALSDSAARLAEIRSLWDRILGVEQEIESLKEEALNARLALTVKKDERERLIASVKELVYGPQGPIALDD